MKVTVKEKSSEKPLKLFPKLMEGAHGFIVLFYNENEGICIVPNGETAEHYKCGQIGEWDISGFTDFDGEITLSNE